MKRILILITTLLYSCYGLANGVQTYYAQVVKVDAHNVIHVASNGLYVALSLGYLTTPVEGEVFHQETHTKLTNLILNKWVRVTELTYGRDALVKPALIRSRDGESINSAMITSGHALPNFDTMPPSPLIELASAARESNLGIWQHIELFERQRFALSATGLSEVFGRYNQGLEAARKVGAEPMVLDQGTKKAYPLNCMHKVDNKRFILNQHVAKNRGYLIQEECPE